MNYLSLLTRYKAWANSVIFSTVESLPAGEALKERQTRHHNMVRTLNHVYVVDQVFQAHLEGRRHGFSAPNTPETPALEELWEAVKIIDKWYIDFSERLTATEWEEPVHFHFIDGGKGSMTRAEMGLHVVNHGTYHRGLVADMMYQVPLVPPSSDLPVFLRHVVNVR